MTKLYFLIALCLYALYGQSQDCASVDVLLNTDQWSGPLERFDKSQDGWRLQDSVARETAVTIRFDSLVSAIRLGFSLDFPPSESNRWELDLNLENQDGSSSGHLL